MYVFVTRTCLHGTIYKVFDTRVNQYDFVFVKTVLWHGYPIPVLRFATKFPL